jgi:hypothetical protein
MIRPVKIFAPDRSVISQTSIIQMNLPRSNRLRLNDAAVVFICHD